MEVGGIEGGGEAVGERLEGGGGERSEEVHPGRVVPLELDDPVGARMGLMVGGRSDEVDGAFGEVEAPAGVGDALVGEDGEPGGEGEDGFRGGHG